MSIIRISMNQINTKVGSLDLNTKKEKSFNHIPYGAKLFIDDGKKV